MNIEMVVSNSVSNDPRVIQEAKALQSAGWTVSVTGWDRRESTETRGEVQGIPFRLVRTGWRHLPDILRLPHFWRSVGKEISHSHIDVLHCHDLDTLPVSKYVGAMTIYDSHENFPAMMRGELGPLAEAWFERIERQYVHPEIVALAANGAISDHLTRQGFSDPVQVLNARPHWKGPTSEFNAEPLDIAYFGGLSRKRGIHELIEGVLRTPQAHLTVAGSGKTRYVRSLKRMATRSTQVDYLGTIPVEDVISRTATAHVVAIPMDPRFPNNRIGTPNKFYEAMATGRPVITTKGTWLADEVESLGMGIVANHSAEGYAEALRGFTPESWTKMASASRAAFREGRDWETQATRLVDLYRQFMPMQP